MKGNVDFNLGIHLKKIDKLSRMLNRMGLFAKVRGNSKVGIIIVHPHLKIIMRIFLLIFLNIKSRNSIELNMLILKEKELI